MTQEVNDVKVIEDTNHILFDDKDNDELKIYYSIKDSESPIVEFELSKKLIQYCGITDLNLQSLVLPIIQYPQEEIEKLLEEYELDKSAADDENLTEHLESFSETTNGESNSVLQTSAYATSLSRTPNPDVDVLYQDQGRPASTPSFLRDRIPELDQSIAAVQEAAVLSSTTPALIITPSRTRTKDMTPYIQQVVRGNDLPALINFAGEGTHSVHSTTERETEINPKALDFGNFHSDFSELFGTDTPSPNHRMGSTEHQSVSRYSRSSCATKWTSDSDSTMQGIQRHKIGLLGEIFVRVAICFLPVLLDMILTNKR